MKHLPHLSLLLFLFLLFPNCQNTPQTPQKILFIGNSLTYYNDMPEMLSKMLQEGGHDHINIESSTYSGFALSSHLNSIIIKEEGNSVYTRSKKEEGEQTKTEQQLKETRDYDIVVLQERTGLMLLDAIRKTEVFPAIEKLKAKSNAGADFWFYQNYPTKTPYPKRLCVKGVCTDTLYQLNDELAVIEKASFALLPKVDLVVPIGRYYGEVIKENRGIELYADDRHPSEAGSYLIALLFYRNLVNEPVSSIEYNGGLKEGDAVYLKSFVDRMDKK